MHLLSDSFLRLSLLAPLSLLFFSACQTAVWTWTPVSTISTVRDDLAKASNNAMTKQFVTKSEWRDGDWVMKKGAMIAFRSDGFGSFSGRLYTTRAVPPQSFHFQSVQYGRDGNILFTAPAADLGHAIHARRAEQDYPVDVNFGFDARQYEFIQRALFTARIRMPAEPSMRVTSQTAREGGK